MKLILVLSVLVFSVFANAKNLTMMQYNAENLFDTTHDAGTEDWTYLPLTTKHSIPEINQICARFGAAHHVQECLSMDWTEYKLAKKINNISRVIKSFDNTGKGPDIIVLQEIENKNVLNRLATRGLNGMGYQYQILIEGDDSRGIDVAVLSKYPVTLARRYPIFVNGIKLDTRGILEVNVAFENQNVVVYANHWPSQSNPTEHRVAAARLLTALANAQINRADLIVALGDFNTIKTDSPYPFNYLVDFIDTETEARKVQTNLNGGTHFYKGEWTSLDRIFIHKRSALKPLYSKFQIMNRPFMLKHDGQSGEMIPARFNFQTAEGFSDHLPLAMEFQSK